jgi:hypothetical protein
VIYGSGPTRVAIAGGILGGWCETGLSLFGLALFLLVKLLLLLKG